MPSPSSRALIPRHHPCSPTIAYSFDAQTIGLHCLPCLDTPIPTYVHLAPLLSLLRQLTSICTLTREAEILRIAHSNARSVGSVYDLPTVPGWAIFQKSARANTFIISLLGSTRSVYRLPRALQPFDDIRPDSHALPEVSPYTEFASVLYEALDSLLVACNREDDVHLRNLYPHSIRSFPVLYSQGQVRRLASLAPAPRAFSRVLECPTVGEILAAPGIVRRSGWITFFNALVPSYVSGGPSFASPHLRRFVPRSCISQTPAPASLVLHDLTFPELYYLILLEKVGCDGDIRTTYHTGTAHADRTPALMGIEFMDKVPFCQAMGVQVYPNGGSLPDVSPLSMQESASWNACRDLAYAEQIMSDVASEGTVTNGPCDSIEESFVYKRDARWDVATLDGFDGWTDEELQVKGHKTWVSYAPSVLMPVEVAAIFSERGFRVQAGKGGLEIANLRHTDNNPDRDGSRDTFLSDIISWSELRSVLNACVPELSHAADRLLLAFVSAGQIYLHGHFDCIDSSEVRHMARTNGVFMDQPLNVLGYKVKESDIRNRSYRGDCLLVPVGPCCTIMMRNLTEKYSRIYGRVYHSEEVNVLPYGCRLGDRNQLKWYKVGAGPWTPSNERPTALVQQIEAELDCLSCSSTAKQDRIVVQAKKGVSSLRLRDISFEAGWSSWSPHVVVSGKGKRIMVSVETYSLTQLVDVLRHLRDSSKGESTLKFSIQEIAGMIVFKEVLIGPLLLSRSGKLGWAPRWKIESKGFAVAHGMSLPRGIGVQLMDGDRVGLLLTRDTMVVVMMRHENGDVWDVEFSEMNGNIESEKLLVGPHFAGFQWYLSGGSMALGSTRPDHLPTS